MSKNYLLFQNERPVRQLREENRKTYFGRDRSDVHLYSESGICTLVKSSNKLLDIRFPGEEMCRSKGWSNRSVIPQSSPSREEPSIHSLSQWQTRCLQSFNRRKRSACNAFLGCARDFDEYISITAEGRHVAPSPILHSPGAVEAILPASKYPFQHNFDYPANYYGTRSSTFSNFEPLESYDDCKSFKFSDVECSRSSEGSKSFKSSDIEYLGSDVRQPSAANDELLLATTCAFCQVGCHCEPWDFYAPSRRDLFCGGGGKRFKSSNGRKPLDSKDEAMFALDRRLLPICLRKGTVFEECMDNLTNEINLATTRTSTASHALGGVWRRYDRCEIGVPEEKPCFDRSHPCRMGFTTIKDARIRIGCEDGNISTFNKTSVPKLPLSTPTLYGRSVYRSTSSKEAKSRSPSRISDISPNTQNEGRIVPKTSRVATKTISADCRYVVYNVLADGGRQYKRRIVVNSTPRQSFNIVQSPEAPKSMLVSHPKNFHLPVFGEITMLGPGQSERLPDEWGWHPFTFCMSDQNEQNALQAKVTALWASKFGDLEIVGSLAKGILYLLKASDGSYYIATYDMRSTGFLSKSFNDVIPMITQLSSIHLRLTEIVNLDDLQNFEMNNEDFQPGDSQDFYLSEDGLLAFEDVDVPEPDDFLIGDCGDYDGCGDGLMDLEDY